MAMPDLEQIVTELAWALTAADGREPIWKRYKPGIGPHDEDQAVRLAVEEINARGSAAPGGPWGQRAKYPGTTGQVCDLWIGTPYAWVAEVKMIRVLRDNGDPDDYVFKHLMSPYFADRSALTDCLKLAQSEFPCGRAVVLYGFDCTDADRPLDAMIEAFELLAGRLVRLGTRHEATMGRLVHPVHCAGRVFGWEVEGPKVDAPSWSRLGPKQPTSTRRPRYKKILLDDV
jgi:hypothetical protein